MKNIRHVFLALLLLTAAAGCGPSCSDLRQPPPPEELLASTETGGRLIFPLADGVLSASCTNLFYYDGGLVLQKWVRVFTDDLSCIKGLTATASGQTYITGASKADLSGHPNQGENDVFVAALDGDGQISWLDEFGSASNDVAQSIAISENTLYVGGYTDYTLPGQNSSGGRDAFVAAYDLSGNRLWIRQFGAALADEAIDLAPAPGGVYVVGVGGGETSAFLSRFAADGTRLWNKNWLLQGPDAWQAVRLASLNGDAYLARVADWPVANADIAVTRFSSDGAELWTLPVATNKDDWPARMRSSTNSVLLTGNTYGQFPGSYNPWCRQSLLSENVYSDVFVAAIDPQGTVKYVLQFGRVAEDDPAVDVAPAANGFYVRFDEAKLALFRNPAPRSGSVDVMR